MSRLQRTLSTPRLTLEPAAPEHVDGLFALMKDPRLTTYLAWKPHQDAAETAAAVESLQRACAEGAGYHWTILEDGAVRGLISLIDVRRRHREWRLDRAEIAYLVDVSQHGRGIATEACAAVVEAAFADLAFNRVIVSHTTANPASGRIPQKLGFRFVGTEREFFEKNGTWYDMNHYELLAKDWKVERDS